MNISARDYLSFEIIVIVTVVSVLVDEHSTTANSSAEDKFPHYRTSNFGR